MAKDRKLDRHKKDRVWITLRLEPDVVARLDQLASETRTDRHSLIVGAVQAYLDNLPQGQN